MKWTIIADNDRIPGGVFIDGTDGDRTVRLWMPAGRKSTTTDTKHIKEIQRPEPRTFDDPTDTERAEGIAWLQDN